MPPKQLAPAAAADCWQVAIGTRFAVLYHAASGAALSLPATSNGYLRSRANSAAEEILEHSAAAGDPRPHSDHAKWYPEEITLRRQLEDAPDTNLLGPWLEDGNDFAKWRFTARSDGKAVKLWNLDRGDKNDFSRWLAISGYVPVMKEKETAEAPAAQA